MPTIDKGIKSRYILLTYANSEQAWCKIKAGRVAKAKSDSKNLLNDIVNQTADFLLYNARPRIVDIDKAAYRAAKTCYTLKRHKQMSVHA